MFQALDEDRDGSGWGIYRRVYDNTGTPLFSESRVNGTSTGHQRDPKVAQDEEGDFVVTWTNVALDGSSLNIFAKRYNEVGNALASQFQVNTTSADYVGHPEIDCDSDGNFVIAWQAMGLDGDGKGIYAQRYDEVGTALGVEFLVNTTTTNNQVNPGVAVMGNGTITITWQSEEQDGEQGGIYAQQYLADGTAVGVEFLVNTTTAGSQTHPYIIANIVEYFIVSWSSYNLDGSYEGVYIQVYDEFGTKIDSETRVNTRTTDFQQFGAIAMYNSSNDLVVAWQDGFHNSVSTHDGDEYGIYIQRYDLTNPLPVGLLSFTAKTQGNQTSLLEWATTTETDNKGFFIQRKSPLSTIQDWEEIGFVEGNKNSNSALSYSFIDSLPFLGVNHYQLKQIDINGRASFSEVRSLLFEGQGPISFYPNPASDYITVKKISPTTPQDNFTYSIFDMVGREIRSGVVRIDPDGNKIPIGSLADGTYFLRVHLKNQVQGFRFTKVR